ncbi:MAG TPA: hypothetical protein VMC43_03570 [Candidatus Paceibacterota bacterium]|nr:hypothetical protein [Candidatus Paceibacterota bacterium]
MNTRSASLIGGLLLFLGLVTPAFAGFGISPPYVQNDSLARNSAYDQVIVLSRSDPVEDLEADITINVPGANDWITVDKGLKFTMAKGVTQVPMRVHVQVPADAPYANYAGYIRVVIMPTGGPAPGTVGISLGAQINVNLNVLDKKITDFKVNTVKVDDLEEGHSSWSLFFPGKITFTMQVENTGNTAFGPTKVEMDISDYAGVRVMEHTENLNRLKRVQPFEIRNIVAELPTRLPPGAYRADFKVYKNDTVVREGELNMSILPRGTIPNYEGYGFSGLRSTEQALVVAIAALAIILVGSIIWGIVRFTKRRRR